MRELSGKFTLMTGEELWDYLSKKAAEFREASILSPFISIEGWKQIAALIDAKPRKVHCQILTRKDILSLALQQLDLRVLQDILARKAGARYNSTYQLRWMPGLHAKMYLFKPHNICVVGSSNLTKTGFSNHGHELNVLWENSPTIFERLVEQFEYYWTSSATEAMTRDQCDRMQETINLSRFQRLRNSMEILRARQRDLPEFSRQNAEHQSADILQRIVKFLESQPTWNALESYLKRLSKGESVDAKIYFLIQNGFLELGANETLHVTERGYKIIDDVQHLFDWISEIEPEVVTIFRWLRSNPRCTYEEIDHALSAIELEKIQKIVRWLASMNIVGFHTKNGSRKWYVPEESPDIQLPKTT